MLSFEWDFFSFLVLWVVCFFHSILQ